MGSSGIWRRDKLPIESFSVSHEASDACAEVGKPLGQCVRMQLSDTLSALVMASSCRTDFSFGRTTKSI